MQITVTGAGVIGLTTAYYLTLDGHDVTVVDRHSNVGNGTSFANGGQLSYSFSDALASPEFLWSLPRLLLNRKPGARASLSPGLVRWGLSLLAESPRGKADSNSLTTYQSALRSKDLLRTLRDHTGVEFDHNASGKMVMISGKDAIRQAERAIRLKAPYGCDNVVISGRDAASIEPALAAFSELPEACIYSPGDEVGDAQRFVTELADWLQANTSCRILLGQTVLGFRTERKRIVAVKMGTHSIDSDAVVVCAGIGSPALVKPLGISLPIRGMRGYSVTLPAGDAPPDVSITALSEHFVYSRLGSQIRIAGFADFIESPDEDTIRSRTDELLRVASQIAPDAADYSAKEKHRWSGVRPMTPDSQPIIEESRVEGVFLNTGHGMLGWTLACASGETVAGLIRERYES